MSELNVNDVRDWVDSLNVSNKRINNIVSPLRQVFNDAFYDGLLERDPLQRLRLLPIEQREPEPFTLFEINAILDQLSGQCHNLIKFAFWSGLRTSEMIGLRWQDIDFDNNRLYVRIAIVENEEKTTKTASGLRTLELNQQTEEALKSQVHFTSCGPRVFNDPKTERPWANDQIIRKRVWMAALSRADIKYRNPYQTRHTYASMMLSSGKNPLWVAQQMGHKDWGMIRKIYGRWIPSD